MSLKIKFFDIKILDKEHIKNNINVHLDIKVKFIFMLFINYKI